MWKQLHSLIYFLARKLGICFQKGKGLWDVSWFFVIRSVLLSMIYCGISEPGGLPAPSSSPENLKALVCSWSIANIYIWQSNVAGPGSALCLAPVCVLTGFNTSPGHGVRGAPGIAFPQVSLFPSPDFHTGILPARQSAHQFCPDFLRHVHKATRKKKKKIKNWQLSKAQARHCNSFLKELFAQRFSFYRWLLSLLKLPYRNYQAGFGHLKWILYTGWFMS